MMVRKRRPSPLVWLAALIALAIGAFWQQQNADDRAPRPATERTSPPGVFVDAAERQAVEQTLALIERGGPFPHKRDGVVFENRERRLPQQRRGYYREYTVPTRGAKNRGARRIVRGAAGETYYTRDHYRTFVRLDG